MEEANMLLKQMIQDATSIREFVIDQCPDVVQQLIMYKTVELWIVFVAGVLALIAACILIRIGIKENSRSCYDMNEAKLVLSIFASVVCFVLGILAVADGGLSLFKIVFAQKLWLVEYAAKLV